MSNECSSLKRGFDQLIGDVESTPYPCCIVHYLDTVGMITVAKVHSTVPEVIGAYYDDAAMKEFTDYLSESLRDPSNQTLVRSLFDELDRLAHTYGDVWSRSMEISHLSYGETNAAGSQYIVKYVDGKLLELSYLILSKDYNEFFQKQMIEHIAETKQSITH